MFRMIGTGLVALVVLATPTTGWAQANPAQKGAAPGGQPANGIASIPGATDVLATVTSHNQTDKITKADLIGFLSRYPLPAPDAREFAYSQAMEMLVNIKLLQHFLSAQGTKVPESKIDEQVDRVKEQLKREGQDLPTMLLQNGSSIEEMRRELANNLRFDQYVNDRATDAVLKRYWNDNRDRFGRTQVRASHILLRVEPGASPAEKEKVRQKLEAIRKEIVGGRIAFAAAANKYSDDPANAGGAGGDLDYFTLESGFVEEFADAAFRLKKGEISQPVETPFGYHLIQITDRKEGKLPEFEQNKPYIHNAYRMELQKEIVTAERKAAKIDIKPMPKDLFPSEPAAGAPVAAPAGNAAPAAKP